MANRINGSRKKVIIYRGMLFPKFQMIHLNQLSVIAKKMEQIEKKNHPIQVKIGEFEFNGNLNL